MEVIDLYRKFTEFEKTNKLLQNKDFGYIWEGIRFQVFDMLSQKFLYSASGYPDIKKKTSSYKSIRIITLLLYHYIYSKIYFEKKLRELYLPIKYVFLGHERRKLESDNLFWDLYVDPIVLDMDLHEYVVFENPINNTHLYPAKSQNLYYLDFLRIESFLHRSINSLVPTKEKRLKRYFLYIQELIYESFEYKINIVNISRNYQIEYYYKLNKYKKILKMFRPEILFLVCGYGKEYIIHAAKDLHIPVVELQHGVLSKYHLGYDVSSGKKEDFADYFFSFGPAWGRMAHFPIPQERIVPIGYQYLNTAINKFKNIEKENQILFLSQGTIGKRLSKFAVNLLNYIPSNIKIIFKLHPGEYMRWETEYRALFEASENKLITVVNSDKPSLYELMAESKWQIGVNSTALFEGMAFKCKTYIVDLPGIEYVETLINNNEFFLVQKPEQIDFTYNPDELNFRTEEYFSQDTAIKLKSAIDFVMKDYYA